MYSKNQLTVDQAADVAKVFFGLTVPFSFVDLKKAYRRESMRLHPDTGGDKESFHEMSSIYEQLTEMQWEPNLFTHSENDPTDIRHAVTVEGIPLSRLGLGLGPTINGSDCERCNHNGYIVRFEQFRAPCDECGEDGKTPREFPCRPCGGSGKFTQRRTGNVVNCRTCNGSGIFKHPFQKMYCKKCGGSKTVWIDDKKPRYFECYSCGGTGEKKIFNPVILKGAVMC